MGWSRTKSLSTELPHKPSMMLWFMTGAFMAVVGALLFIIRASEYVKALNDSSGVLVFPVLPAILAVEQPDG